VNLKALPQGKQKWQDIKEKKQKTGRQQQRRDTSEFLSFHGSPDLDRGSHPRSHPDEKIAETIQLSRLGKHRGAVFAQAD
jgi:hypothetical protein